MMETDVVRRRVPSFYRLPYSIRCRIYYLRAEGDGRDAGPTSRVKWIYNPWEPLEYECALEQIIALGVRDGIPFIYCADHIWHDEYDRTRPKHMAIIEAYKRFRLVSRTVRADILPFICAKYRIFIDYSVLQLPLSSFFPSAVLGLMSACSRLFLKINEKKCKENSCWCTSDVEMNKLRCAWDTDSTAFQERLYGWQQLADCLAGLPQTHNLQLWLSCEVTHPDIARSVVAPLERLRLQECHVRLCYVEDRERPDPNLQAIARRAVILATSQARRPVFRYLDLPTELRLLVLSFTDLVPPPDTPIFWHRRRGFYRDDYRCRYYGWRACHGFCTQRNAGYPSCRCPRPPRAYFMVCKKMTDDARRVFWSSNHFRVMSQFYDTTKPDYDHELFRTAPLEASVFLTRIVPLGFLQYLQNLGIEFGTHEEYNSHYTHSGVEPAVLAHWESVVTHAAPFLTNLTITVFFEPDLPVEIEDLSVLAKQRSLFEVHAQLLLPLRHLIGLKHFYTHASRKHIDPQDPRSAARELLLCEHEQRMEELVMGAGYDSAAGGKNSDERWHWRDPYSQD